MRRNEFVCACVRALICLNEIRYPSWAWWIWNIVSYWKCPFSFVSVLLTNQSISFSMSLFCRRSRENLFMFLLFISSMKRMWQLKRRNKKRSNFFMWILWKYCNDADARIRTHHTHTHTHFVCAQQTMLDACPFLFDWIQVFLSKCVRFRIKWNASSTEK